LDVFSGVAFQQRAHNWVSVNFASAFVVSFNSANAFDEVRLGAGMAHPNEAASRAAKIADVLHIQTPSPWLTDRRCMPYCFRCLVLNDVDVSAPRWKREWLEPTAEFCRVHHTLLEKVPASVFRLSSHFGAARRAINRYRDMREFKHFGRLR
jgi:hypothetical protein